MVRIHVLLAGIDKGYLTGSRKGHLYGFVTRVWKTSRKEKVFGGVVYPPQRGIEHCVPELKPWPPRYLRLYTCD